MDRRLWRPEGSAMTDAERLLNLTNAFKEDILSMSDEEILAEAREDGQDPVQTAARLQAIYEKVSAELFHE